VFVFLGRVFVAASFMALSRLLLRVLLSTFVSTEFRLLIASVLKFVAVVWSFNAERSCCFGRMFFFLLIKRADFELGVLRIAATNRWSLSKSKLLYTRQFLTYCLIQLHDKMKSNTFMVFPSGECHVIRLHFLCVNQVFKTDNFKLLKKLWNLSPLLLTSRSSIITFSLNEELYRAAEVVALKSPRHITFRGFPTLNCFLRVE